MTSEQEPTRGRRKRPRVVAPPQHLTARVELTGSYAPVPHSDSVNRALAGHQPAETSAAAMASRAKQPAADPLSELLAKDQDPRNWGDAKEDLAEMMKREKPPHWG
ncbi:MULTISPECIES: hypothetical protein [unclassified Glutamicibacter]|uniref:hypothetical protein n=1 Tax=unclassified Glutamicibacter TaxID=2627139 RepID=UPI002FCB50BD